jgi:hypothetical protein
MGLRNPFRPTNIPSPLAAQAVGASRCFSSAQALPSARDHLAIDPILSGTFPDLSLMRAFPKGDCQRPFPYYTVALVLAFTLGIALHYPAKLAYPAIQSAHLRASMWDSPGDRHLATGTGLYCGKDAPGASISRCNRILQKHTYCNEFKLFVARESLLL